MKGRGWGEVARVRRKERGSEEGAEGEGGRGEVATGNGGERGGEGNVEKEKGKGERREVEREGREGGKRRR